MSLDWWKVKPSSSPPLSWAEVMALPAGVVILGGGLYDAEAVPLLVSNASGEHGRQVRNWLRAGERWSRPFALLNIGTQRLPRLPRLSFALTDAAVRERRKTVTRRLSLPTWWQEGRYFLGVDKIRQAGAQGLCIGRCGPANREPLVSIQPDDVAREGFDTTPEGFVAMFRATAPRDWDGMVWRLPFSYLEMLE